MPEHRDPEIYHWARYREPGSRWEPVIIDGTSIWTVAWDGPAELIDYEIGPQLEPPE